MSKIELYKISPNVKELQYKQADLEKRLQTLIEKNMETFFGVRFLTTEYVTTDGRIDSLGLDENNVPVIFEYKRSTDQNVINQGLFYLDWLLDHKANFKELVREKLDDKTANEIDDSAPRLICIAAEFTRYDIHAVNQIDRNIDLIRYRMFDEDLILFEQAYSKSMMHSIKPSLPNSNKKNGDKTFSEMKSSISPSLLEIYEELADYIRDLGDDVTEHEKKLYTAFKKIKNFACIEIRLKYIVVYLRLNPDEIKLEEEFSRDVRNIGHWGTGDIELRVKDSKDAEKAKLLIQKSYING